MLTGTSTLFEAGEVLSNSNKSFNLYWFCILMIAYVTLFEFDMEILMSYNI